MNAYTYDGEMYCEACAKKLKSEIYSGVWVITCLKGPFLEGGGEADYPQHCSNCGIFLENPLTDVGYDYVYEQAKADLTDTVKQWLTFYGISDEEWDESGDEPDTIDDEFLNELHDREDYDEDFDLGDDIDEDFDFDDECDCEGFDDCKIFGELHDQIMSENDEKF